MSTALLLALGIGIFEALALFFGSGTFLHVMGVSKVCFYLNSDCSIIDGLPCIFVLAYILYSWVEFICGRLLVVNNIIVRSCDMSMYPLRAHQS